MDRRTTGATHVAEPMPEWLRRWPVARPSPRGDWSLQRPGAHGRLDPASGQDRVVDPSHDADLPALAGVLGRGELVAYRPGRRAVVATGSAYLKVVRPSKVGRLVEVHRALRDATGHRLALPTAELVDPAGVAAIGVVSGRSLHSALRAGASDELLELAAHGLTVLHDTTPPPMLARAAGERCGEWVGIVGRAEPAAVAQLDDVAERIDAVADDLDPPHADELVVTHGDCHDKNVFVEAVGPDGVGLIDLDGARLGHREDDVVNLAVHVALRHLQAGGDIPTAVARCDRLIDAYRRRAPLDDRRVAVTAASTWFRLACLYRFRVTSRHLTPTLLELAEHSLTSSPRARSTSPVR